MAAALLWWLLLVATCGSPFLRAEPFVPQALEPVSWRMAARGSAAGPPARRLGVGWPRNALLGPGGAAPTRASGVRASLSSGAPSSVDDRDTFDVDEGGRVRNRNKLLRRGGLAAITAGGAAVVMQRVAPRPVVLVHGVLQTAEFMREVADWIEREIRGTYVLALEIGNGAHDSLMMSMNWQVEQLAATLANDPKLSRGFNLIGYSQGALLCRAFIERYNRPRVFTFISWLGPQGGQYGVPEYEPLLRHLNWVTSPMWYTEMLQERLSFANYWRDPHRLQLYRERSSFLADLNNEREPRNATYAANIRSLENMLLVYSTTDSIIIPKESGWFAAFADNSTDELVPLEDQRLYQEDWIGLKALADSNRLHFGVTNCRHYEATTSACKFQLFDKLTLPHLLPPSTYLSSLIAALLPRRPRGNARDGGGGKGGWRGPPAHFDAKAVEREELALLRTRCVSLSNQLGQMRTEIAALKGELKAAKARRLPPIDDGSAAQAAARQRRPGAGTDRAQQPGAEDPEQIRKQLDAADARLTADDARAHAREKRTVGLAGVEQKGGKGKKEPNGGKQQQQPAKVDGAGHSSGGGWLRRLLRRGPPTSSQQTPTSNG